MMAALSGPPPHRDEPIDLPPRPESVTRTDGPLRARRDELRLSQEEVARRVGCSVSTYRHWETGVREPMAKFCHGLAAALDLPLGTIVDWLDASRRSEP